MGNDTELLQLRKKYLDRLVWVVQTVRPRYEKELEMEKVELTKIYYNGAHYNEIRRRIRHKQITLAFLDEEVADLHKKLKTQDVLYGR